VFRLLYESASGNLPERVEFHADRRAATVVVASRGYPGSYKKGFEIKGLEHVDGPSRVVFHAGTAAKDNRYVTTGGRVLAVTAWGNDLSGALGHVYEGIEQIEFDGAFWRTDIGSRAL
jgi:phosphoribosylamine--glycine ligase